MRYNQYAYVETSPEKATEELLAINFLPENYSSLSFSELLAVLTGNVLAEATTRQAKDA
jgi:X-Pro dipeptidyl-peptidase